MGLPKTVPVTSELTVPACKEDHSNRGGYFLKTRLRSLEESWVRLFGRNDHICSLQKRDHLGQGKGRQDLSLGGDGSNVPLPIEHLFVSRHVIPDERQDHHDDMFTYTHHIAA